MSTLNRSAVSQARLVNTLSAANLTQLQFQVSLAAHTASPVQGKWTAGDWDNSQVVAAFSRQLGDLNTRLEGIGNLIEQAQENPEPSTAGKITAWLKVSLGQVHSLEMMAQQHLETPRAREDVLSDLSSVENLLNDSLELILDQGN